MLACFDCFRFLVAYFFQFASKIICAVTLVNTSDTKIIDINFELLKHTEHEL